MNLPIKRTPTCLIAVALIALGIAATAEAAAPPPPPPSRLAARPLSPQDIKDYALTGKQGASGLSTVGLGQPAYLEVQAPLVTPASNIVSVVWDLPVKPIGSQAVLTDSPLGANVPIHAPADRLVFQVAGRKMLRPDLAGQYTVNATITTTTATNIVTQTITAGTFMGAPTCALCHSGGQVAPNTYTPWSQTHHATAFFRKIDGEAPTFGQNCISCHVAGYDANTNAVNGGWDDVAKQLGWTLPPVMTNGNSAAMPTALKNVSNIQCESCHGPGSEHAFSLGNTSRISVSMAAGACAQCHDSKTHHIKSPEFANSRHAVATTSPSGPGREGCVGCHTARGFTAKMNGLPTTNTVYEAITCAACHNPHDATNPHQLRAAGPVTLLDGFTTITNAGNAALCMNCHLSRRNATNYVEVTTGGSTFGPHEGPQTDMLVGANGITYGKVIPSSAHRDAVEEACVHCHMQEVASTDSAFTKVGGHTFSLKYESATNSVELVAACKECHGPITTFNIKRQDFDGDGVIDGVQTEVQHLLDKLAFMLPPAGVAKSDITIGSSWTKQQLRAGYNYRFVQRDGSLGVHNLAYAVGLLKGSIADLTGDGNNDGLPDAWQIQYFGSITNPNAAPNATPAGDGMPNWLKYTLGLDPTRAGTTVPGGVVWANARAVGGSTNTIHIYTAAEVAFDTEAGKTYQLQSISSLAGSWQNVGEPIPGTGAAVSYVTPTRQSGQQYFRVVHTP